MPEEQQTDQISFLLSDFNARLRDTEEKNKVMKERTLILGNNLISIKDNLDLNLGNIKKDLNQTKKDIEKMKGLLDNIITEMNKLVRKEEVVLVERMLKDFQPLEFLRTKDSEEMINKKLDLYGEQLKQQIKNQLTKENPQNINIEEMINKKLLKLKEELKEEINNIHKELEKSKLNSHETIQKSSNENQIKHPKEEVKEHHRIVMESKEHDKKNDLQDKINHITNHISINPIIDHHINKSKKPKNL